MPKRGRNLLERKEATDSVEVDTKKTQRSDCPWASKALKPHEGCTEPSDGQ